jgi:hypothetical protein
VGTVEAGRGADYPPPSSAKDKNGGCIPPLPHTSSWRGAYRDNLKRTVDVNHFREQH